MEYEKLVNILKNFYGSSKQLACRLVNPVICFYSSLEFRTYFIVIFITSLALAYMTTAFGLIDLILVFLVLFLIATAFYVIHKFNKGSEKQRKGDYQKAIKYYDNVIRIHQNNRFIFPILNLILGINPETGLKAPTKIPNGRVSRIHKNILSVQEFPYAYELDEYILRNTNIFTATYYNKGNSNVALKDHEEAIKAFDRAIEIDPRYATAYYSRGNSKALLKKDHNGAIEDYSKAIAIDPKDAYAYKNRGNSRTAMKDYQGALKDFDKAIELNPRHKHGL